MVRRWWDAAGAAHALGLLVTGAAHTGLELEDSQGVVLSRLVGDDEFISL